MNKKYIKSEKNKKIFKNVGNSSSADCYSILKEENPFQKNFEEDNSMKENIVILNKFKKFIKIS